MQISSLRFSLPFGCCFALFAAITMKLFLAVYNEQPKPYMDEIFHIPQANRYCNGDFFAWNSKITTPPALYLLSLIFLLPFTLILDQSLDSLCYVFHLRLINLLFSCGNFFLIYLLYRKIHRDKEVSFSILASLNLALLPVLYFFTFLYYTDAGSLFFILLMYLCHLYDKENVAACFGLIAILFRQTNIIWVFFIAGESAIQRIEEYFVMEKNEFLTLSTALCKCYTTYNGISNFIKLFTDFLLQHRKQLLRLFTKLCRDLCGYILLGLVFVVFVIVNKGIVLGDRQAHQASLHIPQLCYFLGFCLFFSIPSLLTVDKVKSFVEFAKEHKRLLASLGIAMFLAILGFTEVHPYLLADNRHLTFYIWKRFLGRRYLNYCFIPVYVYAAWAVHSVLNHKSLWWKALFGFCVTACLVPQRLLELRYFIIPYVMLKLNVPSSTNAQLVAEFLMYVIINAFTVHLFMNRTFMWPDVISKQRIMW